MPEHDFNKKIYFLDRMLLIITLFTLFISSSYSATKVKFTDWSTPPQSGCKSLPDDLVIWVEHGGSDRKTYCNNVDTGASVTYILSYYVKRGYALTHHTMAATESKYSSIYTSYSWMLVKNQ